MVKKIKKYLKFVVCCVLIMSLVAPSYAALGASDGSAFVTKAEFDAALADFNSRLTTFEAGINSKIDSQVTSYLDRNGIWNGAQQDFTGSDVYVAKSANGYNKLKYGMYISAKYPNSGKFSDIGMQSKMGRNLIRSNVVVKKMTKTGLLYLQTYVGNDNGTTDYRMNLGWTIGTDPSKTDYGSMGVNNSKGVFYGYEIFQKNTATGQRILKYAIPLGDEVCFPTELQSVSSAAGGYRVKGYWGCSVSNMIRTAMFFVESGMQLIMEEVFQCNLNGSDATNMAWRPNYAVCDRSVSGIFIVSCLIY